MMSSIFSMLVSIECGCSGTRGGGKKGRRLQGEGVTGRGGTRGGGNTGKGYQGEG